MLFRFLIFTFILLGICTKVAFAQEPTPPQNSSAFYDYSAGPLYRQMLNEAASQRPEGFDFGKFRSLYALQSFYDPLGQQTRNALLEEAYAIQTEKDDKKRTRMLDDFTNLALTHLANIDIVMQSLALAREDRRFGDPDFFEWVRAGLQDSIIYSGDGKALTTGYVIISLGEESVLLGALNVKIIQTLPRESAGTYYNMHDVEAFQTGEKFTVFTNITIPMRFLDEQQRQDGLAVDLRN